MASSRATLAVVWRGSVGLLLGLGLVAAWALGVRGVPLHYPAVEGEWLVEGEGHPPPDAQFSAPDLPGVTVIEAQAGRWRVRVTQLPVRRHLRGWPPGLVDRPTLPRARLDAAWRQWLSTLLPEARLQNWALPLYPPDAPTDP
jgi:hypothetical protein